MAEAELPTQISLQLTESTVVSSASRDTHTAASDRVILGSVSTQRHLSTVDSISPRRTRCYGHTHSSAQVATKFFSSIMTVGPGLTDVAASSYESCCTFTGSSGRKAPPSVFTATRSFAVGPIKSRCTYCKHNITRSEPSKGLCVKTVSTWLLSYLGHI